MRRSGVYRFLLLTGAMMIATWAVGWAGVIAVAIGFAIADRGHRVPWETGRAAAAAWAGLLLARLLPSAFGAPPSVSMVDTVGAVMGVPRWVPPLVTIVYPGLLAWCAATVAVAALQLAGRPRRAPASVHAAD